MFWFTCKNVDSGVEFWGMRDLLRWYARYNTMVRNCKTASRVYISYLYGPKCPNIFFTVQVFREATDITELFKKTKLTILKITGLLKKIFLKKITRND